jgi:hypothetical protein
MATLQTERKQLSDPLVRKMLSSSARHKVVAYPNAEQRRLQQNSTLSTKSSDAILGDNSFGIQVPVLKPVSLRPRSLSTGRQRRKRDDLVQSVYDRLGVTRSALMADAVTPEVAAPAIPQRSKKSTERGRNRESVSEPEVLSSSRPRSLSRDGRLRTLWPPTPASPTAQTNSADAQVSVQPAKSNRNDDGLNQEPRLSKTSSQTREAAPLYSPTRRLVRSPEEAVEMLSPKPQYRLSGDKEVLKTRVYRNTSTPKSSDWRDEKKEADCISPDDLDDSPLVNGPTVKDRMRAFIIPEPPKTVPKKTIAKEYPPLIDIYADERNHETYQPDGKNDEDSVGLHSKKSLQRNNGGKMDPATDAVSPHVPNRVATGKSSGNQLASSFLAAVNTSPEKSTTSRTFVYYTAAAPTVEFSGGGGGGDDQGSATGTVSVSMLSSSASDDQLSPTHATRFFMANPTSVTTSHTTTTGPIKKSHWLEQRNKRLAASEKAQVTSSPSSAQVMPSLRAVATASTSTNEQQLSAAAVASANIERMVDERVKARLFELERRVEEQMRTFLQRMDEKITARIADMDRNL